MDRPDSSLSYVTKPHKNPFTEETVHGMVAKWAETFPDKDAFVSYGLDLKRRSVSCKVLREQSVKFGLFLLENGLQKGDVVEICMHNSIEMSVAVCGVSFAGGVSSFTIISKATGKDLADSISKNKSTFTIVDSNPSSDLSGEIKFILKKKPDCLKKIVCNGNTKLDELKEHLVFVDDILKDNPATHVTPPEVSTHDIAFYFKTSGSTGEPKSVSCSHFSLLNATNAVDERFGISHESVFFCDRPFSWALGSIRTFLASGCTRVIVDQRLTLKAGKTDEVCKIIARECCTHLYLPSYLIQDLLERPDLAENFSTVISIDNSGERFQKRFAKLIGPFCKKFFTWYGSQEATCITSYTAHDPSLYPEGIIGEPFAGVSVKIVDESGNIVPRGNQGEICIKSPYLFKEYKGMPNKYANAYDTDGWFHTGDIGHMLPDGNMVIDGRNAEKITIGTVDYFPREIEAKLNKCPGIGAAVAVGVPDKRMGNAVCACVTVDNTWVFDTEFLETFCDGLWSKDQITRGVTNKPKYFLVFDKFPMGPTGKIDRRALAKDAAAKLKL